MADPLYVHVGDTARAITDTLKLAGVAVDVTGATVVLVWKQDGVATRKSGSVVNGPLGQVKYDLVAGDVNVEADVQLEWEVTFPDAKVLTVPTKEPIDLKIVPDQG